MELWNWLHSHAFNQICSQYLSPGKQWVVAKFSLDGLMNYFNLIIMLIMKASVCVLGICQSLWFILIPTSAVCVRMYIYILACMLLSHVWLFVTPARLLCAWNSPGKNPGLGCHFLLQRIFLTQGSNPKVSCIAGRFFTVWTTSAV